MKTTVVHIVGTLRDGGAEALLRGMLPQLAQEPDLDVHVISVYDPRIDETEIAALGVPVHAIGRRSRQDLSFAPRLISTLRRLRPTIVHAHIHTGKFVGRMAAIAAGVPNIVFTEHGDEARGFIHWTMSRILNSRTARFIVFTDEERHRYASAQRIPLSRIDVIPNGIPAARPTDIDATRHELGLDVNDFAIGTPARLAQQKNQQLVLRAFAALSAQGRPKLRLFIIGDGPDAQSLRQLATNLDLTATVTFMGYRVDAQRLIAGCDLMALPSHWEKMPLVLGESMLAGVPVVSTPWTGIDGFIADGITGYISDDWSVAAFSATLRRAIDDPVARAAISARATAVARDRFDLGKMVQRHAKLYRSLASI